MMNMTIDNLISDETKYTELYNQHYRIKTLKEFLYIDEETLGIYGNCYNINGNWYYFKHELTIYQFFNELLGEELSKHFSLDSVEYEIGRKRISLNKKRIFIDDDYATYSYGLLSKNFREKELVYTNPVDYGYNFLKDLEILDALKCDIHENYEELISNIIKLSVLDFYMQQEDRWHYNILFSKDSNNYMRLCKVFDFENSFAKLDTEYKSSLLRLDLENKKTIRILRKNNMFQEQFSNLMNINIKDIIDRIQDKHHLILTKEFLSLYKEHDQAIKKLVKDYRII